MRSILEVGSDLPFYYCRKILYQIQKVLRYTAKDSILNYGKVVLFSRLRSRKRNTLNELFLEYRKHDNQRQDCHNGTGHHRRVIGGILSLQVCKCCCQRRLVGGRVDYERPHQVVPRSHEAEQRRFASARTYAAPRSSDAAI